MPLVAEADAARVVPVAAGARCRVGLEAGISGSLARAGADWIHGHRQGLGEALLSQRLSVKAGDMGGDSIAFFWNEFWNEILFYFTTNPDSVGTKKCPENWNELEFIHMSFPKVISFQYW